jgi:hypothetical protein
MSMYRKTALITTIVIALFALARQLVPLIESDLLHVEKAHTRIFKDQLHDDNDNLTEKIKIAETRKCQTVIEVD